MEKKQVKTNAMRQLETSGIAYDIIVYDCAGHNFDGELVARQVGLPSGQVFKTLVSRNEKGGVLICCIPVDRRLDLKAIAAAAGCKRVEMTPPDELLALTGYVRGGCSPVGMRKPYPTFLDESALLHERIAVSAGMRGYQMLLSPQDLIRLTSAVPGPYTHKD